MASNGPWRAGKVIVKQEGYADGLKGSNDFADAASAVYQKGWGLPDRLGCARSDVPLSQ